MESGESNQGKEKKSSSEDRKAQQSESPLDERNLEQEELLENQNSDQEAEEKDYSASDLAIPQEILDQLPPREREKVASSLSIMMAMGNRQSSPISKQITSEHITQIINSSEKENEREFEKSKISENTKRLGMGAILCLVIIVFVYAGLTKDKDLSERVIIAGISGIGGFGAGYADGSFS